MAIQPDLELRVRRVSRSTRKGRHTTTAVRLLPLEVGGYVVDTPGIREFALWDLRRDELQFCFPEIDRRFGQCQFRNCTHLHEPGCAVLAAVEAGAIDPGRHESYRRIYESLPDPHDYS
jgi:ribosome biogenesis GTPase